MELDRRSFLKGTLAVGGAAAASGALSACSSSASTSSGGETTTNTTSGKGYGSGVDWLGESPDLSVESCVDTKEADVIVVGSAVAGELAAYAALRDGASVIMLERNGTPHISGSGIGFINSKYQLNAGQPEQDPYEIAQMVFNQFQYRCDFSLLTLWAFNSGAILDDVVENVLDPIGFKANIPVQAQVVDKQREINQSMNCHVDFDPDGNDSLEKLDFAFRDWIGGNGGEIDYETCARMLVQDDDGTVTGLIATDADGQYVHYKAKKGVVMCVGSFGGNEDMMNAFARPWLAKFAKDYGVYNARTSANTPITTSEKMDDGTGHKMMCWAGASIEEIDPSIQSWYGTGYYWWPFLSVDVNGKRFFNESDSWLCSAPLLAQKPEGVNYCWQIRPTNDFQMPMTVPTGVSFETWDKLVKSTMEYYEEDTIEALAKDIDIDPETLKETIDRYNELCKNGFDEEWGKLPKYLDPIDDPPYLAVKATIAFYATATGVKCNDRLQVLDENWNIIPGLYAAGNCVGYRLASGYQTVVPGLCNAFAFTHGYLAGKNCANSE